MTPTIIIDTKEQRPFVFQHLAAETATLFSGDYSIKALEHQFAIERKSVTDLCRSLTQERERFERELHRLRGFDFARLLIVGDPMEVQRQANNPKAIFSSLSAMETRWRIPVVWEHSPEIAARLVERWVWFYWCERTSCNKAPLTCPIPAAVVQGMTASIHASTQQTTTRKP